MLSGPKCYEDRLSFLEWGYTGGMPKISVYLPDELYREARERRLPISSLTQEAIEQALRRSRATEWVDLVAARRVRVKRKIDTSALMAKVRDEFGA